jgi:dihydrodipicolinate synthase/N-acetylneuraminate lyase
MSIVAPELMSQVCNKSCSEETRKEGFKKLFDLQIVLREQGFPASAKYVLNKRGVQLETRCRVTTPEIFTSENTSVLDKYLAEQDRFSLI